MRECIREIVLRPCGFKDLEQVCRLEGASFAGDAYGRAEFLFFLATARDGFVVACEGDKVVGYVIATDREGHGLVQSIAVSPEFRRRGIGWMLMRSAMGHLARRFERVYLQVDSKQDAAIGLYRKLAFGETGKVLKRYYPNGDDAVEMARELGEYRERPCRG